MLVLHHAWRSSASRRVRLCIEEKGLAYEGHVVNLEAMEHHSPEYLRINPNGVIPALIHDGRPLYESGTICEYLDEVFPDPPLSPDNAYDRASMRNWVRHVDERIGNLIIFNWRHSLQKVAEKWTDEELAAHLKKIPSKERQEAWLARGAAALHRGRARRRPRQARRAARSNGAHVEGCGLARGQALHHRRHRGGAVREADRGRNRLRPGHRAVPPPGHRMVAVDPGAAGFQAR